MDTRSKIVAPEAAAKSIAGWCAAGEDPVVVIGFFDPLLVSHAERLASTADGRKLVVVIREPQDPVLSSRARAELVAALRCVTLVVLDEPGNNLGSDSISFEERDRTDRQDFVEHVRRRNEA